MTPLTTYEPRLEPRRLAGSTASQASGSTAEEQFETMRTSILGRIEAVYDLVGQWKCDGRTDDALFRAMVVAEQAAKRATFSPRDWDERG